MIQVIDTFIDKSSLSKTLHESQSIYISDFAPLIPGQVSFHVMGRTQNAKLERPSFLMELLSNLSLDYFGF